MRRAFLYTAGFTVMMLIASLDFLLFVDRLLQLRGKVLPFLVSLSMVFFGRLRRDECWEKHRFE